MLRVLYICYFPVTEPLVETQVIAYLKGLAASGHVIHLLTYETQRASRAETASQRARLAASGITWHNLTYHKRPRLPATSYDIIRGIVAGFRIISKHDVDTIHARVHVPGAIALILQRLTGARLIFDLRGLMAEEYEEAGSWTRESLPFRIVKWVERRCLASASGIVVLTERLRRLLFPAGDDRVRVIPCCADIATLYAHGANRDRMRQELGVAAKRVLVYAGKASGIYMIREMVTFFTHARELIPDLHFIVLTQSEHTIVHDAFRQAGVPREAYTVTYSAPGRIGSYLAAADAGISFRRAGPSQIAASPTKITEYWAAGLPVVCNTGIGDIDDLIHKHGTGVLVDELSCAGYTRAARSLRVLLDDAGLRGRAQRLALETASLDGVGIPRYESLYMFVALGEGEDARRALGESDATRCETSLP